MTVRWKPLLILSGVFLVVALVGLVAFTVVRAPRGTQGILAKARAERQARRFPEADVEYKRALQIDSRDPAIHQEFASLYEEWLSSAPSDKAPKLEIAWRTCLENAAKFGPTLAEPRRRLLQKAVEQEDQADAARWAAELLELDPNDATAHYIRALKMLSESSPNLAEIKRHLAVVARTNPRPARADWLAASVAKAGNQEAELKTVLVQSRGQKVVAGISPVDAMAIFRLRTLDVQTIDEPATLADRVKVGLAAVEAASAGEVIPAARIAQLGRGIETIQQTLRRTKVAEGAPDANDRLALDRAVEALADSIFRKAIAAKGGADLGVYFAYADHLRFRDERARCLGVIDEAFKSSAASRQAGTDASLSLHALAVHGILTDLEDKARSEKAAPHIKALIDGANPRFRAFGHMYQGQIDLERFSVAQSSDAAGSSTIAAKARFSSLEHLKAAANELSEVAEAQARYGVALILSRETDMGRVYLQRAASLGNLEPRYLVWAAWSMVNAGYPEYAEPIVSSLSAEVEAGKLPREMAGVLHLLFAEIHQARRTPESLVLAIQDYQKSFVNGQKPTAAVQLRLAQIEVMLNRPDDALVRLEAMNRAGMSGPNCELLAVNILRSQKKHDDALRRLAAARSKYPRNTDLVSLEAEILVADKKAAAADKLVADFLLQDPENLTLVELRSWILSDGLNRPAEARELLARASERSEQTSPLVRLVQLDLKSRNLEGAAVTIAKVRNRWKDAAIGDMLDAQLALAKGETRLASTFYDAALKKDPSNKVLQYWKAQLDGATNPQNAARVFESLAQEGSGKQLDDGLSLMTAAQSALANLQFESGDVDGAIARYQKLLEGNATRSVSRDLRWKLVSANVAKRQWPAARADIEKLINDPAAPPTVEERVAAAMYFRNNKEEANASRILEAVLKDNPAHPWAASVQIQMLVAANKLEEAKRVVSAALDSSPDKAKVPVAFFLLNAAVENSMPPVADSLKRALAAVEQGLSSQPASVELVQAKCRLLGLLGDQKGAIAFVDAKAKTDPKGPFTRVLLNLYREIRDYRAAERVAADLLKVSPNDGALAVSLVRLVASQSIEARGRGDRAAVESLNARTASLIRDFRARFPADPAFVQLECELAVRRGEPGRAVSLSQEYDKMAPGSPSGPLMRAAIYASQGRARDVAAAYTEALERNPRQGEVRLMLAQVDLRLGDFDQAVRQASLILEADPDQPAAMLVQAKALASTTGSASQASAGRARAIDVLNEAIRKSPKFSDAYHALAEIQLNNGSTDQAIAALRQGLKAVPDDANGLSIAIRILCEPPAPGKTADPARLDEARAIAEEFAGKDEKGGLALAAAIGFHRSAQLLNALPWAEKAVKLADTRPVHLNFGDLLLSLAESTRGDGRTEYLSRALAEFDRVLKEQPDNIEAVNNKAWILHSYQNRSQEALELAEGLVRRAEPAMLPAEFYDTLGSIRETIGRSREAEEAYRKGLEKAPDMPIINFHMGRLIASDPSRAKKAAPFLEKAIAGRASLPPEQAAEASSLSEKVKR